MVMSTNRNLIDRLGKLSAPSLERLRSQSDAASSSAPANTLRFKTGDRVIDLASGQAGLVQLARRDTQVNDELYTVQLADARVVHRGKDELVGTTPVAAAPEV